MRDLNRVISRSNTQSIKWDAFKKYKSQKDIIPLWVADMDFPAPEAVTDAIINRARHPIYGYSAPGKEYYDSIIKWNKKRHDFQIERDWIVYSPGVVPAINWLIQSFTEPGDKIIIQEPVYHPFRLGIEANGCIAIKNQLKFDGSKYVMDYEDFEASIDEKTKLFILCSPHNPVGRVWTLEELKKIGEICLKHNLLVIADEIHGDLIYKGYKHIPFASISESFAKHSITLNAPSKTFNLAGLQCSNVIIPDEGLRNRFKETLDRAHIQGPTPFGIVGVQAAYEQGENWLEEVLSYVEANLDFMIRYFEENLPKAKVIRPEGTYLVWIDFTKLDLSREELNKLLLEKASVALNDGYMFGESGNKYQRINIACPRILLEEGLKRISEVLKEY